MQVADTAEDARRYAYDTAAGLTNSAGQSWDDSMNEAYKRWEVGDLAGRPLASGAPAVGGGAPAVGG